MMTPEQKIRLAQQKKRGLSMEERAKRLVQSWAQEFYLLRRREKVMFFTVVVLLGANILLEVLL